MRPTWLIEANVEGLPSERYQSEIRRQKMACHVVKYLPSLAVPKDIAGTESLPMDGCVIFCGTHSLMRHIHVSRRWRPGGWWAVENLACSTYYAHYGQFLLNRDYSFLPIAEAIRLCESLFARYAQDGLVFVRPDAVDKRFPGTLTDQTTFTHKFFSTKFDPTALILIARPKKLSLEWRLIVANGKVVAGSQYLNTYEREEVAGVPDEVLGFAMHVLQNVDWRPAPMFVIDVCDSEDGLRVLELNSFGCSGHYLADVRAIVEAASELATMLW